MDLWVWIVIFAIIFCVGIVCGFVLATRNLEFELKRGFIEYGGKTFSVTEKRGRLR